MSNSQLAPLPVNGQTAEAKPADPKLNPSYPKRIHLTERAHWQGILKASEDKIASARKKLDVLGSGPQRAPYNRLYSQMLGARDQIAEAVRRMPQETGDLYEEDRHRLEEAVAALDRVFKKWG